MITTNPVKPQKEPPKSVRQQSPQRQPRPDLDTVRVLAGGMATIEVSIDTNRILVGGQPFVQKGARQVGEEQYDEKMRNYIRRERRMLRFLGDQENLIKCHGQWTNEDGEERMLLEYIPGETVDDRIQNSPGQKLETKEVRRIIQGVCRALSHMHDLEVIHRDVKPDNIMIRSDDSTVKLLDLGMAIPFVETGNEGRSVGCVTYASPEQLNELELDGRSDIFSLGIVLVEMLTGRHPFFVETSLEETRNNILNGRMLPEVMNEIPQEYQNVVTRMLAVDRADRYNSCNEILSDLDEISFNLNLMSFSVSLGTGDNESAIMAEEAVFPLTPVLPPLEE